MHFSAPQQLCNLECGECQSQNSAGGVQEVLPAQPLVASPTARTRLPSQGGGSLAGRQRPGPEPHCVGGTALSALSGHHP